VSAEKKPDFQIVNHSIPRRDGRVKVTGKATYVSDVKLIGMAYAKVLRSPYAHARILSIDKSKAEARPGVYCVVTGYDLDGLNPYYGHAVRTIRSLPSTKFATPGSRWPRSSPSTNGRPSKRWNSST
jgi:CO/xanthine dehydrogenase Mo-binding subunit